MAVERRLLWLGATLIGAMVLAMAVWSMDGSGSTTTPGRSAPRAASRTARDSGEDPPAPVRLEALQQTRGEPADDGRNPFRFRPKPVPPPVAPPPAAQQGTGSSLGPVAPAGPPPPPPIALKFIGVVQKADGTKIAVLSDGRRPIHGLEGQEIEGQYRILRISEESLEIAYLDGRGRQTIRLTGH